MTTWRAQIVEASAFVDVDDNAWQDAARGRAVNKVVLLSKDLIVESVDAVVPEQVLLMIVIEHVVSNVHGVDVVDVMVAVVDDRLIDNHVGTIVDQLIRVLVGAVSRGSHDWRVSILVGLLDTGNSGNTTTLSFHV